MKRLLYLSVLALGLGLAQNSPVAPAAPTSPGNAPAPAAPQDPALPGGSPMPMESGSPMPTESGSPMPMESGSPMPMESGSGVPSQGSDFTVTLIAKIPDLLGITPEQFSDYRKQGLSLAQIAAEQGQTLEEVQGQLEELYNQRVDQAANSGEILPQEAAALKENASDTIATFVNDSLGPVTVPR